MALISRLRRALAPQRRPPPLPRPDPPICLIGDVHGRRDLLARLLRRIDQRRDADRARLVVLGDMIDRGPDSAGVLRLLRLRQRQAAIPPICLMGNHERMMLDFLDDPAGSAAWLAHGGTETLASYGVAADPTDPDGTARAARAALPPDVATWLGALPLHWTADGVAAVHAGADPARPLGAQDPDALLWGHPAFARRTRRDGLWIAHGHSIVPEARIAEGRIAADTGAWTTGRLSAVWLDRDGAETLRVDGRAAP